MLGSDGDSATTDYNRNPTPTQSFGLVRLADITGINATTRYMVNTYNDNPRGEKIVTPRPTWGTPQYYSLYI